MKLLITLFDGKINYQTLIDSEFEMSIALFRFLSKWYPSDIRHEQVEEGRFEPTLVCKAFKNKLMMKGEDITASSEIGLFSIAKWDGSNIVNPLNPSVIVNWVANEYRNKCVMPPVPDDYDNKHLPVPDYFQQYVYEFLPSNLPYNK
jgi:hypothetical protein